MAGNIRYQHLYHAQGSICSYVRARSLQFELEKKTWWMEVVKGGSGVGGRGCQRSAEARYHRKRLCYGKSLSPGATGLGLKASSATNRPRWLEQVAPLPELQPTHKMPTASEILSCSGTKGSRRHRLETTTHHKTRAASRNAQKWVFRQVLMASALSHFERQGPLAMEPQD